MAKRFSIKKLTAGALAALMVVTALPVSGITASVSKAADDTAKVYRSYNPNNGEHLYTIDKSEHDNVVGLGYDDEGERFVVPTSSKTPIYRAYDPNSGEHLLVPKDEAEWLETQGWDNEGIKMYADDNKSAGVYRVYNPNETSAGRHNYSDKAEADWLVAQGWQYDNNGEPVFYATELISQTISISSAKQTGAATIEVTLNKAANTGYVFSVTKGTTAQTITTAFDEAGTTAVITLGTAIQEGEYVVKVVSSSDSTESDTATVEGKKAGLKSIDFLGDELILTDSTLTKAATTLVGYNDFGEEVALTGSITLTSTKGTATYQASDNKVIVDTSSISGLLLTPGEKVTLTGVYTAGSSILQVSKTLTVSSMATLAEFEVGELTTTNSSLKGKKLTLDNLKTNTYYFPVKTAKDQYGNKLSASDLSKMMVNQSNTTGNLYINPYLAAGSYAYVNDFVELSDGTIAMQIYKGALTNPGTQPISITGISGYQGTLEVKVEDNPYIAVLNVSAPTFFDNEKAEITVSALDQDGNAINLYGKIDSTNTNTTKLVFSDKNNLTGVSSSIQVTDGTLSYKENSAKESIAFYYTGTNTTSQAKNVVATIMPASAVASNQTWIVQPGTTVAGIKSFDKSLTTAESGVIATGTAANFTWLSSSGAVLDKTNSVDSAKFPTYTKDITEQNGPLGAYYGVEVSGTDWSVETNTDATTDPAKVAGNVNAPGSVDTTNNTTTITVKLYQLTQADTTGSAGNAKYTEIAKKTFTATAYDGKAKSYSVALATGSELLNARANSGDASAFTVTEYDAQGVANPAAPAYTVTVTDDLGISGQTVVPGASTPSAKGTAKATIWVGGKAIGTVDVPYDIAAPAAQMAVTYDAVAKAFTSKDAFEGVTELIQYANGSVEVKTLTGGYGLMIVDQYGMPMANTAWSLGGSAIPTGSINPSNTALVATSAKVTGSWTLTGSGSAVNNAAAKYFEVDTAAKLKGAIEKMANSDTADTTVITKDIDLSNLGTTAGTYSWTIKNGDTLVVQNGTTLKTTSASGSGDTVNLTIEKGGKLVIDGTVEDKATYFTITNEGYITGSGHYTSNAYTGSTTGIDVVYLTGTTWEIATAPTQGLSGTYGGNIIVKSSVTLDLSSAKLDGAPTISAEKSSTIKLPAASSTEVVLDGKTIEVTTDATATAEIKVSSSGETATVESASGTTTVVDESTGQETKAEAGKITGPTMKELKVLTGDLEYNGKTYAEDVDLTVSDPKYSCEAKTEGGSDITEVYYNYTVTGTLGTMSNAFTKGLGYDDSYAGKYYAYIYEGSAMDTTARYNASGTTTENAINAVETKIPSSTIDDASVTTPYETYVQIWTGTNKFMDLCYVIDGVRFHHIYDLSAVTLKPATNE